MSIGGVTLPRPVALTSGAGLQVLDYRSESVTTAACVGAPWLLVAEFPPVDPGTFWLLERITVTTTATGPTRAMVYAGGISPINFLDGTERGNFDVADNASPILVDSNTALTIQWSGVELGAVATARIQYQIVART